MAQNVWSPRRLTLKIHTKYKILGTPISIENGVRGYMERHPLLLEYSITFLRYISEMEGPFDSIYTPLMARTLPFLPMLTPKFDTKYKISGTLSAWESGCWAAERDIHWCSSAAYSSLDVWGRWEELLIALWAPLWLKTCHFNQSLLPNSIQNTRFWVPLSAQTMGYGAT